MVEAVFLPSGIPIVSPEGKEGKSASLRLLEFPCGC